MMEVLASESSIRCPYCQKVYSRAEHLRRHLLSHRGSQQFACEHCSKRFHRRDLLKRHLKICKPGFAIHFYHPSTRTQVVEGSPTQARALYGDNNPLSCDLQSQTEKEVERRLPSASQSQVYVPTVGSPANYLEPVFRTAQAQSGDLLCGPASIQWGDPSFESIETQDGHLPGIWDVFNESSTQFDLSTPVPSMSNHDPVLPTTYHDPDLLSSIQENRELSSFIPVDTFSKFKWLVHYSTATGLSSKFNYATCIVRLAPLEREWNECNEFGISSSEICNRFQWYSDPLALKTNETVSRVKEAVQKKPRNSIITFDWSPLLEGMCISFFSPPNISRLIDLFWTGWYPHWPVIHRPTFDLSTTPVTLLASMMLIGACTSTDISDHNNAKVWAHCVEEMAFSDEYFCRNIIVQAEHSHTTRRRLQALQAAHAICLYQYYEGDDVSKRRVRSYRYGAEVVMARELGFSSAKHEDLETLTESTFSWQSFTAKEEMIRTLLYIFVLDSGFAVANNQPPRIVVRELDIELACPELCFQAATEKECFHHIRTWTSNRLWRKRMTVLSALESFQQMNMGIDDQDFFSQAGLLNLYVIAAAFHSIIFHLRLSMGIFPKPQPLQIMLSNWKTIWGNRALPRNNPPFKVAAYNLSTQRHVCEDWRRDGFMKYAPDLWLLSKKLLCCIQTSQQSSKQTNPNNFEAAISGERLDGFTSQLDTQEMYDDTSMSQFSQLLSSLEDMKIEIYL